MPADNLVGELNGSFRQVMRQMEHERGGIDRLLSATASSTSTCLAARRHRPTRVVRQEIAAIETGYRIGRLLVLREVLGQAPKQFSAATKTFCTELEQRVAAFCAAALGPARHARRARASAAGSAATSATPPPTRSWAAPPRSCATSSASGCSGLPR